MRSFITYHISNFFNCLPGQWVQNSFYRLEAPFSKKTVFCALMNMTISQLLLMIKLKYLEVFEFKLIPVAWSAVNRHYLMFHFREQKWIIQICCLYFDYWKRCLQCQVPGFLIKKKENPSREHINLTGNQTPSPWWSWLRYVEIFSLVFPWIDRAALDWCHQMSGWWFHLCKKALTHPLQRTLSL